MVGRRENERKKSLCLLEEMPVRVALGLKSCSL